MIKQVYEIHYLFDYYNNLCESSALEHKFKKLILYSKNGFKRSF